MVNVPELDDEDESIMIEEYLDVQESSEPGPSEPEPSERSIDITDQMEIEVSIHNIGLPALRI